MATRLQASQAQGKVCAHKHNTHTQNTERHMGGTHFLRLCSNQEFYDGNLKQHKSNFLSLYIRLSDSNICLFRTFKVPKILLLNTTILL